MHLTQGDFTYLGLCLEGFFFGAISVLQVTPFLRSFFIIPGLYSGIFTLHLQIHAKEADSRKRNIVFHALWVLYLLSAALIAIDIADFIFPFVSDNERLPSLFLMVISFADP
jgi:hypothetical protein